MQPHVRATVAACAFAAVTGRKAAGLYDHAADAHLRIAAERRGDRVQARDDARSASYDGNLPDLLDAQGRPFVSMTIDGATVRGLHRASAGYFDARIDGSTVQLFDHAEGAWFAFTVQAA